MSVRVARSGGAAPLAHDRRDLAVHVLAQPVEAPVGAERHVALELGQEEHQRRRRVEERDQLRRELVHLRALGEAEHGAEDHVERDGLHRAGGSEGAPHGHSPTLAAAMSRICSA